jgi:hypothetical protein
MTYAEFRDTIGTALQKKSSGATWHELRAAHDLPYERPCPEWTRRLEKEIGLVRRKGDSRALIWSIK